jgi:hypothetical protein
MKALPIRIDGWMDETIQQIREDSRNARDKFANSNEAGCFHCLKYFPITEIKEWEFSSWDGKEVAICPYCFRDALIPSAVHHSSHGLLKALNTRFYNQTSSPELQQAIREHMPLPLTKPADRLKRRLSRIRRRIVRQVFRRRHSVYFVSSIRIIPVADRKVINGFVWPVR